MHYQGRRWGGDDRSDIYDACATFGSYGVKNDNTDNARNVLLAAVPETHKQFLSELDWVVEVPTSFAPHCVIAIHAGLHSASPAEPQLAALRHRDAAAPQLQVKDYGRFEALSGRSEVKKMHPELQGKALLVSGHHGSTRIKEDRCIVDTCAGRNQLDLEGLILPEKELISSKELTAAARNASTVQCVRFGT